MFLLRFILAALFLTLASYTLIVGANHGWNLAPVFIADIAEMAWPGQFNLDFLMYLVLSALWIMWRHEFSPAGIGLGLIASVGGMLFFSLYLLVMSFRTGGDMRALLLGRRADVA